jgi:DNA-binding XRE family transcriptional regulator
MPPASGTGPPAPSAEARAPCAPGPRAEAAVPASPARRLPAAVAAAWPVGGAARGERTEDQPGRRDLGRRLAAVRKAAGYTQRELAAVTGYSRGTVSNAEIGGQEVGRSFWVRCDQALETGDALTSAFDGVRASERCDAAGLPAPGSGAGLADLGRVRHLVCSSGTAQALAGYRDLGWPVSGRDGRLELATGEVADALELPWMPGLLAATLWLYSRGRADEVWRLPALPDPSQSLAVITAGQRCFFLAASGSCPWTGDAPAGERDPGGPAGKERAGPVIRWHAGGARIPVPPSRLPGGGRAAWAHLPALPMVLAPPAALLSLLATAAASAGRHSAELILPGGVRLVPAAGPGSSR